jgi:putative hydrolase of the HAD superfamily
VVSSIIGHAKALLDHPVELLDDVARITTELAADYRLVLVTKGDLFHQEAKLAASGLGERFAGVEIVAEKSVAGYRRVQERYDVRPDRFVMVGNSMRSDVLPVLEAGSRAVYIPYHITWAFEHAELPDHLTGGVTRLDRFAQLPAALANLG